MTLSHWLWGSAASLDITENDMMLMYKLFGHRACCPPKHPCAFGWEHKVRERTKRTVGRINKLVLLLLLLLLHAVFGWRAAKVTRWNSKYKNSTRVGARLLTLASRVQIDREFASHLRECVLIMCISHIKQHAVIPRFNRMCALVCMCLHLMLSNSPRLIPQRRRRAVGGPFIRMCAVGYVVWSGVQLVCTPHIMVYILTVRSRNASRARIECVLFVHRPLWISIRRYMCQQCGKCNYTSTTQLNWTTGGEERRRRRSLGGWLD